MARKDLVRFLILASAVLLLLAYVVAYPVVAHRPPPIAAPSVLYELERQGRSFVRVDFDYEWQYWFWRPMVIVEDLLRSEEVVATHGLWRGIGGDG